MRDPHFDWIAPLYERLVRLRPPQALLEALALEPTHHVLDLGGGTGRVAQFLPAQQVVVADLSHPMLRYARRKPGLQPVVANAAQLPFATAHFDRVLIVDALHHIVERELALHEAWRVLRPGGRLVVEEPDITHWVGRLVQWGERLLLMHSRFWTPEALAQHLAPAPTRIVRHGPFALVIAEKPAA